MRVLRGVGRFGYQFLLGDDWKVAAAVLVVLALAGLLVAAGVGQSVLVAPLVALALLATFVVAVIFDVRSR